MYEPTGTDSDPIASLTPGLARSSSERTSLDPERDREHELVGGEHDRLLEQSVRVYSSSGSFVLAAANTSGFTPRRICAASSSEPAN